MKQALYQIRISNACTDSGDDNAKDPAHNITNSEHFFFPASISEGNRKQMAPSLVNAYSYPT